MSDINVDPVEYLYQQTLKLSEDQARFRKWIDLMNNAGENTTELEVTWKNNEAKIRRWKTALAAEGKTF